VSRLDHLTHLLIRQSGDQLFVSHCLKQWHTYR